jgi:hypothetical protein
MSLGPNNLEGTPAKEAVMQLESKRIESIIHHWILLEECKQRQEQLLAREQALKAHAYDAYLRVPDHSIKIYPVT